MYIEEIIIFNLRSCRTIALNLSQDNPNIFIGLNDCGKSTILQAFDLLLGDKAKYNSIGEGNYKSDLSNSPNKVKELNNILTSRKLPEFDDEDSTFVIGRLTYKDEEHFADLNLSTHLKWSLDSCEENTIWLAKKFSSRGSFAYLLTNESETNLSLWNLTQADINKQIKEHKVTPEEIENENGKGKFSNFEKIRAVYSKVSCSLKW